MTRKPIALKGAVCFVVFSFLGCGVKGDPQPPLKPAPLGRGQPTFKEAVKEIKPTPVEKKTEENSEKKEAAKKDENGK